MLRSSGLGRLEICMCEPPASASPLCIVRQHENVEIAASDLKPIVPTRAAFPAPRTRPYPFLSLYAFRYALVPPPIHGKP